MFLIFFFSIWALQLDLSRFLYNDMSTVLKIYRVQTLKTDPNHTDSLA